MVICVYPWLKKHPSRSGIAAQMELRPPKKSHPIPSVASTKSSPTIVLVLVLVLGVTTPMHNLGFTSETIISLLVPIELRSNPTQQPRTQRTVDRQRPVHSREISPESHLHHNNPPRMAYCCPDAHAVALPPSRSCRQRSEKHHPESVATRGRSGCYECHSLRGARPSALRYPSGSLPNRCPLITATVFPKVSDAMVRGPVGTAGK